MIDRIFSWLYSKTRSIIVTDKLVSMKEGGFKMYNHLYVSKNNLDTHALDVRAMKHVHKNASVIIS